MQWAGVSIGPGGGSGGGKGGRVVSKGEGFWAAIRITERIENLQCILMKWATA